MILKSKGFKINNYTRVERKTSFRKTSKPATCLTSNSHQSILNKQACSFPLLSKVRVFQDEHFPQRTLEALEQPLNFLLILMAADETLKVVNALVGVEIQEETKSKRKIKLLAVSCSFKTQEKVHEHELPWNRTTSAFGNKGDLSDWLFESFSVQSSYRAPGSKERWLLVGKFLEVLLRSFVPSRISSKSCWFSYDK